VIQLLLQYLSIDFEKKWFRSSYILNVYSEYTANQKLFLYPKITFVELAIKRYKFNCDVNLDCLNSDSEQIFLF